MARVLSSVPAAPPVRSEVVLGGLLQSSFELRAGLEVRTLAISMVPADVLRELQRLRESWVRPAPGDIVALERLPESVQAFR